MFKKIRIFNIHNHLNELSSLKFLKEYFCQDDQNIIDDHLRYYLDNARSFISSFINIIRICRRVIEIEKFMDKEERMKMVYSYNQNILKTIEHSIFAEDYDQAVKTCDFKLLREILIQMISIKLASVFTITKVIIDLKIDEFVEKILFDDIDKIVNLVKDYYDPIIQQGLGFYFSN